MGFVKSLLGGKPGGFQAQGPTQAQLNTSWDQQQAALKQQQDFINAVTAQNGLTNQSNVFNQMQGLSSQFQNIAAGAGPNPAMAALNQATGANVANQAALMAGQRGAGANPALLARQAAMQGAQTQQQAVGQAATMQAQQQLAALQALQQQQAMMGNLAGAQVNEQQGALSQYMQGTGQQRAQLLGQQQAANDLNAKMAQMKAGMQGNLLGSLMGGVGSAMQMIGKMGAGAAGGGGGGSMTGDQAASISGNATPDMYDIKNAATYNDLFPSNKAEGGEIKAQSAGPRSSYGMMLKGIPMAKGGKVPAMVSPGEVYLKPEEVKKVADGKKAPMDGEKIPGKPKVGGAKNDYANDTVPKTLEEGGIVLPRSVTKSKNPDKKAAEFVKAILAKKGMR